MNDAKSIVIVMFGGQSTEHEISCRSAATVIQNISQEQYELAALAVSKYGTLHPQNVSRLLTEKSDTLRIITDEIADEVSQKAYHQIMSKFQGRCPEIDGTHMTVFSTMHGTYGEDGCWQGFFELAGCSYVGPDVLGSALSMDKVVAKQIMEQAGIPVAPYIYCRKNDWLNSTAAIRNSIADKLGFPCFVKPSSQGSSVGITRVESLKDLDQAIHDAFSYDRKILIEKAIHGREIEFAVMGYETSDVSLPGEVVSHNEGGFYSYESKYIKKNAASVLVPAPGINPELIKKGQELAARIYSLLNLECMARIDFFFDESSQIFHFNEANSLPGFTSISQYPKLWEAMGIPLKELIQRLVGTSIRRHEDKAFLQRGFTQK